MILKLIVMAICSILFWWGGYNFHNARRFILPIVLTSFCIFLTNWDWRLLFMLSVIGAFCLGYGEKSPLRHVFGDGWGRGIWGILVAICLSLPLFLTHHLLIYFFLPYLALNFTLENALKKLPQWLGDPIIGLGFSLILLLIH